MEEEGRIEGKAKGKGQGATERKERLEKAKSRLAIKRNMVLQAVGSHFPN